jgi:glyceraldehyde 3-phosphate dehydrogenase
MKKIRVAINGFGRIGRAFAKIAKNRDELQLVAVNDLGNIQNFAYLLKYDTAYGVSPFDVSMDEEKSILSVDGTEIKLLSEKDKLGRPKYILPDQKYVIQTTHKDEGAK